MNGSTTRSGKKSKDTLKQMKMQRQQPKAVRHCESNPKREIRSITGLSQEIGKSSNKQSEFTLKGT